MTTTAEGALWSGLETEGMIKAKCSLLIPEDMTHNAVVKALPPQNVVVYQEKIGDSESEDAYNKENTPVHFKGATILQLEPVSATSETDPNTTIMPITLTIAGRCVLTPENYSDFRLLMRTAVQSEEMNCPRNGAFDWPDVNACLQCPCCGNTMPIPCHGDKQEHEYWMVFYPLLQLSGESQTMTLGTRTICRMLCLECMDDLLEGLVIEIAPGKRIKGSNEVVDETAESESSSLSFKLPVSNVLAEAGSASFLEEGPPRPDTHPHVDDILDAWTLYNLWEQSGAWEALQHDYRAKLSQSLQQPSGGSTPTMATTKAVSLKHRMGRPCGNQSCSSVHGQVQEDGKCCRLYLKCPTCYSEFYCSRNCLEASVNTHNCAERRREREERGVRTRKVECSHCTRKFPYTKMKKCSSCRLATYCSRDCQRMDWQTHKFVCNKR